MRAHKTPATPPVLRRPGRPPGGDAAGSRERLLDIAQGVFSERGIAATPMSAITKQAGISAAMMHYHFTNRDQLLDVLVEERILPIMRNILADDLLALDSPQAVLPAMAERIVGHLASNPWIPALWVKEILSEGGQLRPRIVAHFGGALHAQALAKLRRWHAEGQLPADLDPGLLLVSVIGLTVFPLAAAGIWRHLPGMAAITNQALQRHAVALLQHGIANSRCEGGER